MRRVDQRARGRASGSSLGVLGSGVAFASANLAAACCGLFPAAGSLLSALGLGVLQYTHVQRPVLYVAGALAVLGIGLNTRRHRNPAPLLLAALSVPAVLVPFHVAMDVTLFRLSVYGGVAGLVLASALNLVLTRRRARAGADSREVRGRDPRDGAGRRSHSKEVTMRRSSMVPGIALTLALGAALAGVGCGGGGSGGGFERIDKRSNYSFQETLDRLTAAVRDANLVLVKEVDYQTMLKMVNMETAGLRGYEVFHPSYGARLFRGDPRAGLEVPLRIFIWEDGGKAIVSYYVPSSVFAGYNGLGDLGRELDQVFATMTDRATK